MLSDKELVEALITNIEGWSWSVYRDFKIDEDTGKALVKEYRRMKQESKHDKS